MTYVHSFGRTDWDAPTVLLLHGLTEAGTTWPDVVERWGDAHRLIAPDLRGHGTSPRFTADQLGHTHDIMLADVLAILDEQPHPVVVVGHSMGGNLAVAAALARPEQVRALVLEDPASGSGAPPQEFIAENEAFLDSMAAPADRDAHVRRVMSESGWSRAEAQAWADCKPLVDRQYIHSGLRLSDLPWEESFEALTMPTLLVVPDPAPMAPERSKVNNPLVTWEVVADAGHCVRRDQPARYFAAVESFLADCSGGDASA